MLFLLALSVATAVPKALSTTLAPVAIDRAGRHVLMAEVDSFGAHGHQLVDLDVESGMRRALPLDLVRRWASCHDDCGPVFTAWAADARALPEATPGWTLSAEAVGGGEPLRFASCSRAPTQTLWTACAVSWPGGTLELTELAGAAELSVTWKGETRRASPSSAGPAGGVVVVGQRFVVLLPAGLPEAEPVRVFELR